MSKEYLPTLNFPFTRSVRLQHSIIDYGTTGQCAVFKNEQQTIQCFSQKKPLSKSTVVRLHAEKPSLPLNLPNNVCRQFAFDEHLYHQAGHKVEMDFNYIERNLRNFSSDHGDLLYQALSGSVAGVMRRTKMPVGALYTLRKYSTHSSKISKIFGQDLYDIPLDTMDGLLAESFVEDMLQWHGVYYANSLAYQTRDSSPGVNITLFYPGGYYMNKLLLSSLNSSSDGMMVSLEQEEHEAFTFPGKIHQITTANESFRNPMIAVRCDYTCSFFHHPTPKTSCQQGPGLQFLGSMACKTKPCSVLVSPYIAGEVAVAMESGSVHLWKNGDSVEVVKDCSACTTEEFEWYFCEFGFHPRQIIRGKKTGVELLDLRTRSSTAKELLTLPSVHFFNTDQLSCVQKHPDNPNYVFLGTKQFLVIMDQRFEQNPVMKMSHSLLGPIKYINVVPDAGTSDVLVFVGEYHNHEVHCYQYHHGDSVPYGATIHKAMCGLAPQLTTKPWKVSSYSDWPNMVDIPDKSVTLETIKKKLSASLHGLACIPYENNLIIVQLSQEGDLFYQTFKPTIDELIEERTGIQASFYEELNNDHTGGGGCGKQKPVLPELDVMFIRKWSEKLKQDSYKENISDLGKSKHSYVDTEVPRSLLNLEYDTECSLCKCTSGTQEVVKDHNLSELCFYCGLEETVARRLTEVDKNLEPVILTNNYLGIAHEVDELQLFDDNSEYCDPLGKVMLKNWYSEEQTPINLKDKGTQLPEGSEEVTELHEMRNSNVEALHCVGNQTALPEGNLVINESEKYENDVEDTVRKIFTDSKMTDMVSHNSLFESKTEDDTMNMFIQDMKADLHYTASDIGPNVRIMNTTPNKREHYDEVVKLKPSSNVKKKQKLSRVTGF